MTETGTATSDAKAFLENLERQVQRIYEQALTPLAQRYAFELPQRDIVARGLPTVLFLGNHSSGKSTFINYLLGAAVQKTGLAPVDDGFTLITHGETDDEFDGQTVVSHPRLPYRNLERFGPGLLARLRMKARPYEVLKALTLIDSPGMIDAPDANVNRGYDFEGVVRFFAEAADLILFFFDPDKPGTTGETMSVFTRSLSGLDHKMHIIMNKVDRFSNMRDFARAYGALCWNLSKVIPRKDLPHVFNTYIPEAAPHDGSRGVTIPLADFDVSRDEVVDQIERAPAKRADNLVSSLYDRAHQLEMHARVCSEVSRELFVERWRYRLLSIGLLLITGIITAGLWGSVSWSAAVAIGGGGVAIAGLIFVAGRSLTRRLERSLLAGLDEVFERVYAKDLAMTDRADLRGIWEKVRERILISLRTLGPSNVPRTYRWSSDLKRLQRAIADEIPGLRRSITSTH